MADTSQPLYLNIIWHQHQPLYLDPGLDQLQGPWVRTHGTKDYYDMASMLEQFPDVHCTFNLTSSLLQQLRTYYLDRLGPFVDVGKNRVDARKFLARWKGKTDPWIDLLLKPSGQFDQQDRAYLISNPWNALYITEIMLARFPEYRGLKTKALQGPSLTEQDIREIKFWFFLAYFDPDFLERRVDLADGSIVDLTDLVRKQSDGTYVLKRAVEEDDCNRILAETYKILANIIPVHKKLMYDPVSHKGQIQIATTPYYHPILPLLADSDAARSCQPHDPMPPRFRYPEDARAQVGKAVVYFKELFGREPLGMWPAEGGVSQEAASVFSQNGIQWIAADEKILARSTPAGLSRFYPYRIGPEEAGEPALAIVFRDTELSDKIGFAYQHYQGEDAANDFISGVFQRMPPGGEPGRLLTVILDGENAWEWYKYENDGKGFLKSLYRRLSELYADRTLVTVTMSEYISGNPLRDVPPHPVSSMQPVETLYPGSWINANFDTWIGREEKNRAWSYLLTAREDLEKSGIARPPYDAPPPGEGTPPWHAWKAWEELYAAEGSDWFWWYGSNPSAPSVTAPFDLAFLTHLRNIYFFARQAKGTMPLRDFEPIQSVPSAPARTQGAMVKG
ncbi:MAG TPA: glycoside hydrolase family 57 protein [Bacteroidota bacterium]|jgi:alpha-amylase/alpha-mannosidase (GH57 family)